MMGPHEISYVLRERDIRIGKSYRVSINEGKGGNFTLLVTKVIYSSRGDVYGIISNPDAKAIENDWYEGPTSTIYITELHEMID